MEIGKKLKNARVQSGMTQENVAEKINRDWLVIFGCRCHWYYMFSLNITKKCRFMIIL